MRPLESLLSKSQKAMAKLAPGTWQRARLRDNVKALRMALALLKARPRLSKRFARADAEAGRRALASMRRTTAKARARFARGTPQHTLQTNRLRALRLAEGHVKARLAQMER